MDSLHSLNRAVIARQMTRSFPQVTGREVSGGG